MHVGLNLVFLVPGETGGMEVYARELVPAMIAAAPDIRFTAFVNRETGDAGSLPWRDYMDVVEVPVAARNRLEWVRGEQTILPRVGKHAEVDVMHSLGSTAPGWGKFVRVVTIHDLIYRRFPEAHMGLRHLGMRLLVPLAARRSQRVIADSQSTANDITQLIGTPASRIDVIPLGLGNVLRAEPASEAEIRERFELGDRRLLLSLSAKRPHKNLAALLGALALIEPAKRPVLVMPGYATPYEQELRKRVEELDLAADVRFADWVAEAELEGLWSAADAFVYPSLYEGFGLPVLEAMARGVPVACAAASSLPEVVGDAALMFDPLDERAIAAAIERLLNDVQFAQQLRVAGRERAAQFTWERTARRTLDVYREAFADA